MHSKKSARCEIWYGTHSCPFSVPAFPCPVNTMLDACWKETHFSIFQRVGDVVAVFVVGRHDCLILKQPLGDTDTDLEILPKKCVW